ncbi:MAG: TIR domain-containing protein [Candidatus Korobacteraceae bacterium]
MAEVFISYARVDQGFARDLNHALQKLKRDTWIDWRSIPDSAEWRAEIFAAIDAADNFLFIISPDSLRSEMCKLEVAHALAGKKRVTTILYHPVDWNELLPGLREIQWIHYPELGFDETFRRLIAALDTDLEWVRQHTRLAEKARDWENSKRNESFLLRGMALQDALKWLAQSTVVNEPKVLPLQEEYIRASQKWEAGEIERLKELTEHETRQKKRFRRFSLVLGVALLLALAAVGVALWQRSVAHAREMISASVLSQNADLEISVLIAAQAVAATWPWGHAVLPEAEQRLHDAVLASHVKLTVSGHSDSVSSVAWSPDGKRLATASEDGTVQVYAMDIRSLMKFARQRVTAHPSVENCKKYLHVDKCPPFPTLPWW